MRAAGLQDGFDEPANGGKRWGGFCCPVPPETAGIPFCCPAGSDRAFVFVT